MNKCIYCGKDKTEIKFSREHVIPELLGVFDNNITLRDCVCSNCNTGVFGPLETRFKEDTHEGIMYQRFNLSNSYQIRIRNKKYKISTKLGFDEPLFNEMFPFFKINNGKPEITPIPQIKIKGYAGNGYLILLIDNIKKLPRGRTKFKALKNLLKGRKSVDVSIFTYGDNGTDMHELNEAIELVRELGIPYKPGTQKSLPPSDPSEIKKIVEINVEGQIDSDTVRVLAKIAFNHFAYCAIDSGNESILHHPNFSKIKSYILGNLELPLKDVVIEQPSSQGAIADEKERNIRLIGHMIIFDHWNGKIISKISLLGSFVYTICLGSIPDELKKVDFGNGHMFDPVNRKIIGLTKNEERRGNKEKLSFSLFNGY